MITRQKRIKEIVLFIGVSNHWYTIQIRYLIIIIQKPAVNDHFAVKNPNKFGVKLLNISLNTNLMWILFHYIFLLNALLHERNLIVILSG